MLQLKNIKKTYGGKNSENVEALKDISLEFRDSEFVSVLGPSGCGKTTFLNIIGGLDGYTSGDLIINGKSTKQFNDRDWDTYRNHSVGFVFQSYNLISHQSILSNVELALTLAGIDKKERRNRAIQALKTVGLEDKIHKKPTELSGGQMQRVAIARAIVGNPDILLADEPTGALDSETSIQIMDLLKKIAKDRLVIMVTHNPDLAKKYSTRIIKLLDGNVIDDSNPYSASEEEIEKAKSKNKKNKRTYMKYSTALSLSFKNLMTKKGRTTLTAFAGSIGIIGIALILALSNGIQNYINTVEESTLSSYPVTITKETIDISSMMQSMVGSLLDDEEEKEEGKIYSSDIMDTMLSTISSKVESNNLQELKKYLENGNNVISDNSNAIQYEYDLNINLYKSDVSDDVVRVNPSTVMDSLGLGDILGTSTDSGTSSLTSGSSMGTMISNTDVWSELLDNEDVLKSQYNLLAGSWPSSYNEVVLMVDKEGRISDYTLYSLGIKDQDELSDKFEKILEGDTIEKGESTSYSYEELLNLEYKLILNSDYYEKENGIWLDKSDDEEFMKQIVENAETIKVVGIIQPSEESVTTSTTGGIGYLKELKEYVIEKSNNSEIVQEQKENPDVNVFSGLEFPSDEDKSFSIDDLTDEQRYALSQMTSEQIAQVMQAYKENEDSSYEGNLKKLGAIDLDSPTTIYIYPKDFEAKEAITDAIENYNQEQIEGGKEENVINYTDIVGVMISSITKIVNVISYVLIAFVSISLIVSSIMIAIITYISVLERTKEIGILRSIGASKTDVSRVFNAETIIEGLIAGCLGIGVTLLLSIPINIIVEANLGVSTIAALPTVGGVLLVALSVFLTVIAGIIPSRMAAKQDPAVALRTE